MYSPIANNTFSYILTQNEFRDSYPENIRASRIKLTTITMISSFSKHIDVERIRNIFEQVKDINLHRANLTDNKPITWHLKPSTFYNQITLTYDDGHSTKSIKIFPNGSIQVAGCEDLFNCTYVISGLVHILQEFDKEIIPPADTFRVVMINSNFSLNYNINLIKTTEHFEKYSDVFKVSFEPDRYSAVKVKFKPAEDMKEITTSIFGSGKIIITGAETLKEIVFAYNIINQHINDCPSIRVSRVEITDRFDEYFGYKIDDVIAKIKSMGFESWVNTITNRQINF
jgi:TATA-box binding protein (TBP) (component of TFIID and TFIIIB)|tara:strand:- start:2440 stop:3294 length:855 start_codon:yes stop_codon:yes gene_type:complete